MSFRTVGTLIFAGLALVGCHKVCGAPNPYDDVLDRGVPTAQRAAKQCIRAAAHSLAQERDQADVVARAVVERCRGQIIAAEVPSEVVADGEGPTWRAAKDQAVDVIVSDRASGCTKP